MVASGVWSEKISLQRAHDLVEVGRGTRTMRQELERIGYLEEMEASHHVMPLGVCPCTMPNMLSTPAEIRDRLILSCT